MPAIETTVPAEKMGTLIRGYRPHGYRPQDTGVRDVSPARGFSQNAADLNIPGAGKGIAFQNDVYIPSFPDNAAFRIPSEIPGKAEDVETQDSQPVDDSEVENKEPEEDAEAENREPEEERKPGELTAEEQSVVADLQARDREVRAHEQAHISVGGSYITGGAVYQYENGPDNKRYAVGGEVGIDSSPIRDNPEATIAKMQIVRAAALAPAEPSGQDRAVAAAASREEAGAAAELRERRAAEARESAEAGAQARNKNNSQNIGNDGARQPKIVSDAISAYTKPADLQANAGLINLAA
jgi:hypothetical protein